MKNYEEKFRNTKDRNRQITGFINQLKYRKFLFKSKCDNKSRFQQSAQGKDDDQEREGYKDLDKKDTYEYALLEMDRLQHKNLLEELRPVQVASFHSIPRFLDMGSEKFTSMRLASKYMFSFMHKPHEHLANFVDTESYPDIFHTVESL